MRRAPCSDATASELQWFFRDASYDAEIAFLLAAMDVTDDAIPAEAFDPQAIGKMRRVRNTLLALDQPHADVLSWVYEVRAHNEVLRSHFSWPGVAIRTVAAQTALTAAGMQARVVDSETPKTTWPGVLDGHWSIAPKRTGRLVSLPTGDFHHRRGEQAYRKPSGVDGVVAFLLGLKPKSEAKQAIEAETGQRVERAFAAYEAERPRWIKSRRAA